MPCRKIFILISYIPKGRKIRPGQVNGAGIGRIFRRQENRDRRKDMFLRSFFHDNRKFVKRAFHCFSHL